jgi:cytochrome c556
MNFGQRRWQRLSLYGLFAAVALVCTGGAVGREPSAAGSPSGRTVFESLSVLMADRINPAANLVFHVGNAKQASATDWDLARRAVADLVSSAADMGAGGPEADEHERSGMSGWSTWLRNYLDAAEAASRSVAAMDQAGLAIASDRLLEECEACHSAYAAAVP